MTSHPRDFTRQIVAAIDSHASLCDHVHLPVQSGSDRVLARMQREYTRAEYLERIAWLRSARRRVSITTDLIVGFPGETEADFAETLSLLCATRTELIARALDTYMERIHGFVEHVLAQGSAAEGLAVAVLSFLTIRYMISPIIPAMRTTISHRAPLMPLFSASLYTQTQSRIAMISHTMGMQQTIPVMPAISRPPSCIPSPLHESPTGLINIGDRFLRLVCRR
jgi:hypothetical protein